MYILFQENADKTKRVIQNMSSKDVLTLLESDNGCIEVIPMTDPNSNVRIFFDIDSTDKLDIDLIVKHLSNVFGCNIEGWAIAESNRASKYSYHVVSTKYKITISELRNITKQLQTIYPCFDDRCLYFSIFDELECGYFRLPNQSKKGIRKDAPPLRIIKGELSDFFVTCSDELTFFKA